MLQNAIQPPRLRPYPFLMSFNDLRVYDAAGLLRAEVDSIISEVPRGHSRVTGQLDRSTESVKSNIGEARGQQSDAKRATFYAIARGSSDEVRSQLETLVSRAAISAKRAYRAIGLTYVIGKMLTALLDILPPPSAP